MEALVGKHPCAQAVAAEVFVGKQHHASSEIVFCQFRFAAAVVPVVDAAPVVTRKARRVSVLHLQWTCGGRNPLPWEPS